MIRFIKTTRNLIRESEELRAFTKELSVYSIQEEDRDKFLNQLFEILEIVSKYYDKKIITVDQSMCEYYQRQFVAGRKINYICEQLLRMIKAENSEVKIDEISEETVYIGFKNNFKFETIKYWKENLHELDRILKLEVKPLIKNAISDIRYYQNCFRYF